MSFEKAVVETALKELFNGRHFSICDLEKIGRIVGSNPSRHPDYKYLHALHCVNYSDMPEEVRSEIPMRVIRCLRPDALDIPGMAAALMAEGRNFTPIEDIAIPDNKLVRIGRVK